MPHASPIDQSAEKAHIWINEVASELESEDGKYAYRVLRAFLHALRDRLTVEEAAQLAAQLPTLIRGVYYENWVPARTPMRYRDVDEFLDRIAKEAQMHGDTEASYGCAAAAKVLREHVSAGELEDVLAVLPKDLRQLVAG
jgi:uncharacterized protein (DUF2267 family)